MPNISQHPRGSGTRRTRGHLAVLGIAASALAACSAESFSLFDEGGELGDLALCDLNLDFVKLHAQIIQSILDRLLPRFR